MTKQDYIPSILVDTSSLTREEWLTWRRKGIGGSDAALIIGVSPYATARDLYYDKRGVVSAVDEESNWVQLEIGHLLEDLVAKIFSRKTGYPVYQIKKMFSHPLYPFMLADIDYFVRLPNGETAILEIKTTNYNARDLWWQEGQETVPVHYEIQGRHYMAVTNIDRVYYCCLYGNTEDEVIIRCIERDPVIEKELISMEEDFWNHHVLAEVPPPYYENGELVLESVKRHIGKTDPNAPAVSLEQDISTLVARYLELKEEKKKVKSEENKIESEMKRLQGCILTEMGKSRSACCSVGETCYQIEYNSTYKPTVDKDHLFRFKEQYPELYDRFVTLSEIRKFYVKKSQETAA